jgi:hypothetical protein
MDRNGIFHNGVVCTVFWFKSGKKKAINLILQFKIKYNNESTTYYCYTNIIDTNIFIIVCCH